MRHPYRRSRLPRLLPRHPAHDARTRGRNHRVTGHFAFGSDPVIGRCWLNVRFAARFPVFAGRDVVPVEIGLESGNLQAGDELVAKASSLREQEMKTRSLLCSPPRGFSVVAQASARLTRSGVNGVWRSRTPV